jgi:hypothetical protein
MSVSPGIRVGSLLLGATLLPEIDRVVLFGMSGLTD